MDNAAKMRFVKTVVRGFPMNYVVQQSKMFLFGKIIKIVENNN